jgi:hypothetical protein
MAVDGHYKADLLTVGGPEPLEFIFESYGNYLGGTINGHFGKHAFSFGTVVDNRFSWKVELESPVGKMELKVEGTVEVDEISGQLQLGSFRPTPFKGNRVRGE